MRQRLRTAGAPEEASPPRVELEELRGDQNLEGAPAPSLAPDDDTGRGGACRRRRSPCAGVWTLWATAPAATGVSGNCCAGWTARTRTGNGTEALRDAEDRVLRAHRRPLPGTPSPASARRPAGGSPQERGGRRPEPAPGPHPGRADFPLEVRREALYGGPRGTGGHLAPVGRSDRARPRYVWEPHANGTYYAVFDEPAVAPRDRTRDGDAHTPAAGDLAVAVPDRTAVPARMMFPWHWTEDDAVYAAEQAYLHALRDGRVEPVPGGGGSLLRWEGVYAGVRIEGELRGGSFTGFRPAEHQEDLDVPPYLPAPPLTHGPRFSPRAEDIARLGDRGARTGVHVWPPAHVDAETAYGVRVSEIPGTAHDNGTVRAEVSFLDPLVRPGGSAAGLPSRWERHREADEHVMFPRRWRAADVRAAVDAAYAGALARGLLVELDGAGAHAWRADRHGVRIEGVVDGQHVAYRPSPRQPRRYWPAEPPVARTGTYPVTVRTGRSVLPGTGLAYLLFADGEVGAVLSVPVTLVPEPGMPQAEIDAYVAAFEAMADERLGRLRRADDAHLLRVRLDFGVAREGRPGQRTLELLGGADPTAFDVVSLLGLPGKAAAWWDAMSGLPPVPDAVEEWTGAGEDHLTRLLAEGAGLRPGPPEPTWQEIRRVASRRTAPERPWPSLADRSARLLSDLSEAGGVAPELLARPAPWTTGFPAGWTWPEQLYAARQVAGNAGGSGEETVTGAFGLLTLRVTVRDGVLTGFRAVRPGTADDTTAVRPHHAPDASPESGDDLTQRLTQALRGYLGAAGDEVGPTDVRTGRVEAPVRGEEPSPSQGGAPGGFGGDWGGFDASLSPVNDDIDAVLEQAGVPARNLKRLQAVADARKLRLELRQTNRHAVKWLERGALPKPEAVKAKSVNDLDLHLGAKAEHLGLVGYFEPVLPSQPVLEASGREQEIRDRYEQRRAEFTGLAGKMAALRDTYPVIDGVVHGYRDGRAVPVTSDHDIFDITTPGGSPLTPGTYERAVSALVEADAGVMHGAATYWEARGEADRALPP
ncbi:OTU domain-containing protein OS=Streptomyces fumanus OX=67302 GN=GCM10018772_56770 PE=4 SV=1 [Streptomyces fumanus]